MLDKIFGKKKDDKDTPPNLRGKKDKKDSDIGGRFKDMVGKVTKKEGDEGKKEKKLSPERKIPRPMPKPKPTERPKLRPPQRKPDKGGFGRKVPDEDQRTLVGAAVFGLIFVILIAAGYYFFVYQPYQVTLEDAKAMKLNETNTYFSGPLALNPSKQSLLAEIEGATTPEEALAIDVLTPATDAWRTYQNQQINANKDPYGRVMITYAAGGQKNVIMKVADAQKLVSQADAGALSKIEIKTPDTVAVPIIVSRLQAAGGLVNVGNSVDVYLNTNQTATNQTQVTNTSSPSISGATVLAILRAKDSGVIDANKSHAMDVAMGQLTQSSARSEAAKEDVEQLIRAVSARNWDQNEVNSYLNAYGWRLSDFERTSNLGELDAQYLLLLEVPRENAVFLIQNMNSIVLTVPTQQAPDWMINELKSIYG